MIVDAQLPKQLDIVKGLFRQYADSLDVVIEYQGFSTELNSLPAAEFYELVL